MIQQLNRLVFTYGFEIGFTIGIPLGFYLTKMLKLG